MVTGLNPRPFLATVSFISAVGLMACTPDAKNGPIKVPAEDAAEDLEDNADEDKSDSSQGGSSLDGNTPENTGGKNPSDPGNPSTSQADSTQPGSERPSPPKNICPKDKDSSEHDLVVRPLLLPASDQPGLELDFMNPEDRSLQVVSLYVNKPQDKIPTFTNNFKFNGTSYWMIAVDNPFDEYFSLPSRYQSLTSPAIDVTKRYGGALGGLDLKNFKEPICLKFTIVTFEPEKEIAFRQSEIRYPYDPQKPS